MRPPRLWAQIVALLNPGTLETPGIRCMGPRPRRDEGGRRGAHTVPRSNPKGGKMDRERASQAKGTPDGTPEGPPLVAVCQLTSTDDVDTNLRECEDLASDFLCGSGSQASGLTQGLDGPIVQAFRDMARRHGVWLSVGVHERGPTWSEDGRVYNSHLLLDEHGEVRAVYRKTHLFDVDLPGVVRLKESDYTLPGPCIAPPTATPIGMVGLGICYDVRFPEFSQRLRQSGAEVLTYPSAFTLTTGMAHWEPLLRARAIETQCYVVAAAQAGRHSTPRGSAPAPRVSFGHGVVVDPWGCVVAQCGHGNSLALAEVDTGLVRNVRSSMPVHEHRRHDLY
ncbi:deaminated glutathione amidase isoform X3 [Petromyzon marinus]|uniref:Deaminated glutathione amidase isoform X2 n=1 Tax=Petromyzon marinus TaxID=7757 RepID=A0AAJ7TLE1_PETMA|nr:deaminated glutathione amidase isoform X2 [Petromyzon marinus]